VLRFFGTEVIIPASLALMFVFLLTGYAIQDQEPHWTMGVGFLVAGTVKFVVGCWSAISFISNPQMAGLAVNDWTLFGCFVLSMCFFLYFLWRILNVVTMHVKQLRLLPNSDVKPLRKTMLRFQLLIVVLVLCLLGGAPVLFYDAYKHQSEDELTSDDPNDYKFEPALWCKLVWAFIVLYLVPNPRPKPKLPRVRAVSAITTKKPSSDSVDSSPRQAALSMERIPTESNLAARKDTRELGLPDQSSTHELVRDASTTDLAPEETSP